jgi:hypothetical protein
MFVGECAQFPPLSNLTGRTLAASSPNVKRRDHYSGDSSQASHKRSPSGSGGARSKRLLDSHRARSGELEGRMQSLHGLLDPLA